MGLFDRFKSNNNAALPKGAHLLTIKSVQQLSTQAVQLTFEVPTSLSDKFKFTPGQYLTLAVEVNGEQLRRSYSICSSTSNELSIGVKAIANGKVSNYLQKMSAGTELIVFEPEGNFLWKPAYKKAVAIAAGSGITPIMSMLQTAGAQTDFQLFYGNKSPEDALFLSEILALTNTQTQLFYSQKEVAAAQYGRIDDAALKEQIKTNLSILQADAFFLCGPQEMVESAEKTLAFFGVSPQKIHKELFFVSEEKHTPTNEANFSGKSHVKVMIDGDIASFDMHGQDKTILELSEKAGLDAPFSCRGGVCSSCRAKVLKGSAAMRMNHTLTDSEIADGYILTCQAYATSAELIVSFDA
jgi:ring-1,2-phenylacetyl-CoA epoxidase subunit PaaE